MAKLYFRYGAMNSGKSTALMQVAHNYEERNMKVLLIKPSKDTKAEQCLESRLGVKRKVDILLGENDSVYNNLIPNIDVNCILVDEAQFLTEKQVDELSNIAVMVNIPVICYGLRTDFKTNGFPGSIRLLEIADSIEEMKTICRCGSKAIFNARFLDNEFVSDGDQVLIDGESEITYESLCAKCYYTKKQLVYKNKC